MIRLLLWPLALVISGTLCADDTHYRNILIGERAAGLGGAYNAISDDPTGIYHNPAGMAFSQENYLSVSANAFSATTRRDQNIYPGQDFVYSSQSLIPVFFGFSQSLGRGKFGVAVAVPNADSFDQTDTITAPASTPADARSFTRRFFRQETTYLAGPAYALEVSNNISVGVSLLGFMRTSNSIDDLLVLVGDTTNPKYILVNKYLKRTAYGVQPKVGLQFMPWPKLALGLTASVPLNLAGSGSARLLSTKVTGTSGNVQPLPPNGNFNDDLSVRELRLLYEVPDPYQLSLGAAYFFDRYFLLSAQFDAYVGSRKYSDYPLNAVYNWSVGGEYYVYDWLAFRLGVFSNNANTPDVNPTGINQPAQVNMIGGSSGISLYRSGSSLTLGFIYSRGRGQGQALNDTPVVQNVEIITTTVYLSGSYQL